MNLENSALQIYTIGHSNCPLPEFLRLLRDFDVQSVADVRSSPYSRYNKQFNREPLHASLPTSGIEYVYAGHLLGGRPADDTCYRLPRNTSKPDDFQRSIDYSIVMTKGFFLQGVEKLLAIARTCRVAVLCSEEDPQRCHRHHLIGRCLLDRGVDVRHIRRDGSAINGRNMAHPGGNQDTAEQPRLL